MCETGDVILFPREEQTGVDVESRHVLLHLQFSDDTEICHIRKVSLSAEVVINCNLP